MLCVSLSDIVDNSRKADVMGAVLELRVSLDDVQLHDRFTDRLLVVPIDIEVTAF